jgi:hypothetical protein
LQDALRLVPPRAFELAVGDQTFAVLPVEAPELGVVNLYATDVTAARVLERFPDWNPNPVLRVTRDGRLQYANPTSDAVLRALGIEVGGQLPDEFFGRVQAAATRCPGELVSEKEVRGHLPRWRQLADD